MKSPGPPGAADYARLIRAERIMVDALKKIARGKGSPYCDCMMTEAAEALRDAYPPVKP